MNGKFAAIILLVSVIGISHSRLTLMCQRLPEQKFDYPQISIDRVRNLTLGYDQLAADLAWLQLVQCAGDKDSCLADGYAHAQQCIEMLLNLDPKFVSAYWFGAFLLGGEAHKAKVAEKMLDEGIVANPGNWSLPFIAGVNQYLYAGDTDRAARYYRMASSFPGAPVWLGKQATILESGIPSMFKQINIWQNIYNESDPPIKERAREELTKLWLTVFRSSPTAAIKSHASNELNKLKATTGN